MTAKPIIWQESDLSFVVGVKPSDVPKGGSELTITVEAWQAALILTGHATIADLSLQDWTNMECLVTDTIDPDVPDWLEETFGLDEDNSAYSKRWGEFELPQIEQKVIGWHVEFNDASRATMFKLRYADDIAASKAMSA